MTVRPLLVMLRPLGLGDFLTGVPAYRAIACAFPDHRRILAAPAELAPLADVCGAIDAVVPTRPLEPLPHQLHYADVAVDLHGRGPASHLVLLAAKPRRLIAFANDAVKASAGFPKWREDEHEVTRWCRMLSESDVPADASDLRLPAPPLTDLPLRLRGAAIVHPGAAAAARRWPVERWARVVAERARAGDRVLITGGPGESDLAQEVAQRAGVSPACVVAGGMNLMKFATLVAHASYVVSGDTGAAHLATAFGRPSVTLFGPTPPQYWGPPQHSRHRVLWKGTLGDPHGKAIDPGLLAIEVSEVLDAIEQLSQTTQGRRV